MKVFIKNSIYNFKYLTRNITNVNSLKITETNVAVANKKSTIKSTKSNKEFKTVEEQQIIKEFPDEFLKKRIIPSSFYVGHPEASKLISTHLKKKLQNIDTILESNPGTGILTKELLKIPKISKILLIEKSDHFMDKLKALQIEHSSKIRLKKGDFVNLWKSDFKDKIDQGSRIDSLLRDVPRKEFHDEPNMRIFACVGSVNFFKHLINSIVFERSLSLYGRSEMFLVVPPPLYVHLTCDNEVGYMVYRTTSILFQIMFEYQFIKRIPKEYFFPHSLEYDVTKTRKLAKIRCIDPEFLYLVRIIPRKNIYDLCPPEDIQGLWYFIKQNCVSRKTKIIPNLEKWVPGCGMRLIINLKERPIKKLKILDNSNDLPKYSKPCTEICTEDYFPQLNIFTEFGDLTPSQLLTLFCQFKSWPEYRQCSFLPSLENSLLKMQTITDDTSVNEIIDTLENDDSTFVTTETDGKQQL